MHLKMATMMNEVIEDEFALPPEPNGLPGTEGENAMNAA
jgi:hypothetical protein